jgi:hypothetical protein
MSAFWHFCDMVRDAHEGRFCLGADIRALVRVEPVYWVHDLVHRQQRRLDSGWAVTSGVLLAFVLNWGRRDVPLRWLPPRMGYSKV